MLLVAKRLGCNQGPTLLNLQMHCVLCCEGSAYERQDQALDGSTWSNELMLLLQLLQLKG